MNVKVKTIDKKLVMIMVDLLNDMIFNQNKTVSEAKNNLIDAVNVASNQIKKNLVSDEYNDLVETVDWFYSRLNNKEVNDE